MVSDLDYHLPAELIAQCPLPQRDASRLLVVNADGTLRDQTVMALPELLPPSLLVFNNTRVFPARLRNMRAGGGGVEFLLVQQLTESGATEEWLSMARPAKRLRDGEEFCWGNDLHLVVLGRHHDGELVRVKLQTGGAVVREALEIVGEVPLPPYIDRAPNHDDRERYQTVFAKEHGAVAAPTAGLHFTEELLHALQAAGHKTAELTLHVGPGTFKPIQEVDLTQHTMHEERYEILPSCADAIAQARKEKRAVVAVGTTVVRALESAVLPGRLVRAGAAATSIFIRPPFCFAVVDRLITNFHLPQSTLLALVMAFAGSDTIRRAYAHAIAHKYRFYSYGDAMLLQGHPT